MRPFSIKQLRPIYAPCAIIAALLNIQTAYGNQQDDDANTPCCRDSAHPRWYASISGSATFLSKTDITHPNFTTPEPDDQTYKVGFGMTAAVGYQLFSGVRTELEVTRRQSTVEHDTVAAATPTTTSGEEDERSMAYMFNTYIDMHNKSDFVPYVGAGIGEAYVINPRLYYVNATGDETGKVAGWTMAYQFMLGVGYEFKMDSTTPVALNLGYRYFSGTDLNAKLCCGATGPFTVPNNSSNIELGARLYFD